MEETSYLTDADKALQPLLQMARECATSNVSTIRTLVLKVLSDPQIFAGFDQIKQEVQPALSTAADGETLLRTLDLFSYGTYRDYANAAEGLYLALNETQLHKLRQLTVVTLVQRACIAAMDTSSSATGGISYGALAQELGFSATPDNSSIESLRQVEMVVISCIYARIVSGQLCQKSKSFRVLSQEGPPCQARDVPVSQISTMLQALTSLQQKLEATTTMAQAAKTKAQSNREADVQYWKKVEEQTAQVGGQFGGTTRAAVGAAASASWAAPENTARSRDLGAGRPSSSTSRQTKRSRGGFGGALGEIYGRY